MKAIIVDDEPKAIQLIQSYLAHFQTIEVVATFRNGLKAFEYIANHEVELVFLDINMPHISGISLSKMLPEGLKIIFTTAYSEYAVESYDIQATDYLLKPISLERFTRAMSRILAKAEKTNTASPAQIISIRSGGETFRVKPQDICFLEKDGNYMTYHLKDKSILARTTVADALSELPESFVQTHKSFVVNIEQVTSYDKSQLTIGAHKIPLSPSFREQVLAHLDL